jgi:hypothetical protein
MTHNTQQRPSAIAILHICTGYDNGHQEAEDIDQDMALAPLDPFGPIEAFVTASISHLHRLRIDTGGTGLTVAAFKDAHITASDSIQMRPEASKPPLAKIMIDDAVRRQIMRHRTPGNAASNNIENPVENLAFGIGFGSTARFCLR